MKSNKALVVDFALTDREEDEPEEGEEGLEGAEDIVTAEGIDASEEGLSANASKVQELADTLASEIEAEGIAASDDPSEADKDDEDYDI